MYSRTEASIDITITASKCEMAVVKRFIECLLNECLCSDLSVRQLGTLMDNGTLYMNTEAMIDSPMFAGNEKPRTVNPKIVLKEKENKYGSGSMDFGLEGLIRDFVVSNRRPKTISSEMKDRWIKDMRDEFEEYMKRTFWNVCREEDVKPRSYTRYTQSHCNKKADPEALTEERLSV